MHKAEIVLKHCSRAFLGIVDKGSRDKTFLSHVVHSLNSNVGSLLLTSVVEFVVVAYIQVILSGLKTANAEQRARETEHINTSLVVVILTGEQTLDSVGAVECLSVRSYAAKQSNQLVSVPSSVLTAEQIGTSGSVVSAVCLVDILTEHIYSVNAAHRTGVIHLSNDVAGSVVILGYFLGAVAVLCNYLNLNLSACGHIGRCGRTAAVSSEIAVAVKQLLYPVNSHQWHTLDIVYTVKVRSKVDSADVALTVVTCDRQTNDGVSVKICLEVGHLVKVLSKIYYLTCGACLSQIGCGTAYHIYLGKSFLPELPLLGSAVALILVLKYHTELFLYSYPCRLKIASAVALAVSQCNGAVFTLISNVVRVKEQTRIFAVVAGSHSQNSTLCELQFGSIG